MIRLAVTKSGKRRDVPIQQVVYEILAAFREPRVGRVFVDQNIRVLEDAVVEAKIESFTFHECRHHFASWFVMRGGRLEALTMRYAHLSPDYLRSEIAKTERSVGQGGSKTVAVGNGVRAVTRPETKVAA